jgi:hypothetical protein
MGSRRSNPSVKPGQKNPIDSNTIRSSSLRDYTGSLQKPGQPPNSWSRTDFDRKIQKLKDLTAELRTARAELTTLNIPVPTGWMETMMLNASQPQQRKYSPSALGGLVEPILPMNAAAQEKKD